MLNWRVAAGSGVCEYERMEISAARPESERTMLNKKIGEFPRDRVTTTSRCSTTNCLPESIAQDCTRFAMKVPSVSNLSSDTSAVAKWNTLSTMYPKMSWTI